MQLSEKRVLKVVYRVQNGEKSTMCAHSPYDDRRFRVNTVLRKIFFYLFFSGISVLQVYSKDE